MTTFSHNSTNVMKGDSTFLHLAKPLLNLHMVKLIREGVVEEEDVLRHGLSAKGRGGSEAGEGQWVSGDRGLDPCHCVFHHWIWLL